LVITRTSHLAVLVILAIAIAGSVLLSRSGAVENPPAPTAAIIDQLSASIPNPEFVNSSMTILRESGFLVDYYPSERVTVDLYRELPSLEYDLIVFRTHVGRTRKVDSETGEVTWPGYVSIFTGEPFTGRDKYPKQGVGEGVTDEGGPILYAITTGFVEHVMNGKFNGTVIVMMGCDGLLSSQTAKVFLDKGASAFIGWNDYVTASHTDASTNLLLDKLFTQRQPVAEAVAQTAGEMGPDPWFGSQLQVMISDG